MEDKPVMAPAFAERLSKLNNVTSELFRIIPESSPVFHENPAKGKWSAAQVIQHLYESERLSLMYMQKKILGELKPGGPGAAMRSFFLNSLMRVPFRLPSPPWVNPVKIQPERNLESSWQDLRKQYEVFLRGLPAGTENKLLYKHPVGGRLTSLQCLDFFYCHIKRHKKQIEEIRRLLEQSGNSIEQVS